MEYQYQHILPTTTLKKGDPVTNTTVIGTLRDYPSGNHLHMAWVNTSGSIVNKLCPFYTQVSVWDYGRELDYFTNDYFSSDNTFTISAEWLGGPNPTDLSSVQMYYRINGGSWQGPLSLTFTYPTTHRWSINLKNATGTATGQTLDFYLVGNADFVGGSYTWGLWPQYYRLPPKTPSEFISAGQAIRYYSYTIK